MATSSNTPPSSPDVSTVETFEYSPPLPFHSNTELNWVSDTPPDCFQWSSDNSEMVVFRDKDGSEVCRIEVNAQGLMVVHGNFTEGARAFFDHLIVENNRYVQRMRLEMEQMRHQALGVWCEWDGQKWRRKDEHAGD